MKPRWHLLLGFIFSYILVYFFHFSFISGGIIFLSSFLIDTDHYFWYVFSFKDLNPINALRWYYKNLNKWRSMDEKERLKFQKGVFIFHSLPLIIILGLLSPINKIFLSLFLGISIHLVADLIALVYYHEPLYIKLFPSLVIIKNQGKKSLKEF